MRNAKNAAAKHGETTAIVIWKVGLLTYHSDNGVDIAWQQSLRTTYIYIYTNFDFCHAKCGEVLIAVDYWTKGCMAKVTSKKSVKVIGESLANFLGEVGYAEPIEVRCGNEPVLAAGVRLTKDIRTRNWTGYNCDMSIWKSLSQSQDFSS